MERFHFERLLSTKAQRRRFLIGAGTVAASAIASWTHKVVAQPRFSADPFNLGVASGDPLPNSVVLWTRLAPDPLNGGGMPHVQVPVRWQVALDENMRKVVQRGVAMATPEFAHSVHVDVRGLQPERWYWYQFKVGNEVSPIGRTRTAPAIGAPINQLNFAFVTCQKWEDGYYSAYRRLAEEDLDLVFHLGDYIYEYGIPSTGGARKVSLPEQFSQETQTLEQYRLRYALYKTDPDLQKAHALFPFVVTWDDHEVDNDYTNEISEKNDPVELFLNRRAAAYQAYYEHMPLRQFSQPQGTDMLLYRRLTFGNLAEFSVLDTRQYRSDHPCGDGETPRCSAALDPSKTMLGKKQERWLLDSLDRSQARWNVLAQQILMAELDHKIGSGEVFWNDSWDGYPLARDRVLSHITTRQITNPVVITGDWHSTFVNDLKLNFKDPNSPTVATEFVTPSLTSNGDANVYGPYYGPMIPENPHIKFFDGDRRGYFRVNLNHQRWQTDLRIVTTVSRPDASVYTLASFVVEDGRPGVQSS
ncbi:alkaline phosphatase [Chlorogloeopsis fritschii PCC 6912]|uniref:Alkaline phosphatase n=1 Tax=Chlorogloeopsis fritschii PCC 6912 TaxID=211165 RepID=A0A433NN33_CHLFR|nr:alkaline phosphatase D family protein [Chlorogloeopsis fritschii]RUR84611.1 alkaline phosphatase [Chlorogloeopsis fritschii PCC 6912]